jgi:hypothetical protein
MAATGEGAKAITTSIVEPGEGMPAVETSTKINITTESGCAERGHLQYLKSIDITPLLVFCLSTLEAVQKSCCSRGPNEHCQQCTNAATLAKEKILSEFPHVGALKEVMDRECRTNSNQMTSHDVFSLEGSEEGLSAPAELKVSGSPEVGSTPKTRGRGSTASKKKGESEKEPSTPKRRRMAGEKEVDLKQAEE